MMKKYPDKFFMLNGIKNKETERQPHNSNLFEKWKNGETDRDFINANMIELK